MQTTSLEGLSRTYQDVPQYTSPFFTMGDCQCKLWPPEGTKISLYKVMVYPGNHDVWLVIYQVADAMSMVNL